MIQFCVIGILLILLEELICVFKVVSDEFYVKFLQVKLVLVIIGCVEGGEMIDVNYMEINFEMKLFLEWFVCISYLEFVV